MYRLVPAHTLAELNAVELSILIDAAYFHDIGMASSQAEFYRWLGSAAYAEYVSTRERWATALRRVRRSKEPQHGGDDAVAVMHRQGAPGLVPEGEDAFELRCLQDIICFPRMWQSR